MLPNLRRAPFASLTLAAALLAGCAHQDEPPMPSRAAAAGRPESYGFRGGARPASAPPAAPAPKPPVLAVDDATRLQIFLDRENFGPGKLDGKSGEFTRKAVEHYARARGKTLPPPGPGLLAALPEVRGIAPYRSYTLTAADAAQIGVIPDDRAAQGKQKSLPYTSLGELLAERFHAERDFLRRLNPALNLDAVHAGDTVRVPNIADPLEVTRLAQHGRFLVVRKEFQPRVVKVDTKEKVLDVFEDGQILASFPITPGSTTLPAPVGTWKILSIASMPYFRYDDMMLNHGVRSENFVQLPPGPNSPVGVMWMGLNKSGIGLHGTNNPETIGRAASHGCIRLANWDAARLSLMVKPGTTTVFQQ